MHPSRTASHAMKIRNITSGLVTERSAPDAREMVESGAWKFVDRGVPSIHDTLSGKSSPELAALLNGAGIHPHPSEEKAGLIETLVPLIEAGTVVLS